MDQKAARDTTNSTFQWIAGIAMLGGFVLEGMVGAPFYSQHPEAGSAAGAVTAALANILTPLANRINNFVYALNVLLLGYGLVFGLWLFPRRLKESGRSCSDDDLLPMEVALNLAPLTGFLGTVVSLVQLFWGVSISATGVNQQAVARSLQGALVTTVFGLIAAFFFHLILLHDRSKLIEAQASRGGTTH